MTAHRSARVAHLLAEARRTGGFLDEREGHALVELGARAASSGLGPLVEIGSYLGRSTLYLAAGLAAARADELGRAEEGPKASPVLFSVDHHHGSEEMQAGWPDHDPELIDPATGLMDTLGRWRRRIEEAGASDLVVGVVGTSAIVARNWGRALSLVFIDGGHGRELCWADYRNWSAHLAVGGLLVFHDVFPDERDGGRPPYECYADARASGRFVEIESARTLSLRALLAVAPTPNSSAATPPPSASSANRTAAAE